MFNPEDLQILSHITIAGFGLVFLVGLAMAFNPRSLSIVPVLVGYIAGAKDTTAPERALRKTLAFVLGMTLADVILGVLFALIGRKVSAIFGPRWEFLIGIVLIVLGLRWLNVFKFRTIGYEMEPRSAGSVFGAFLLGIPFSMSFCPFCVPVLLSILTVAAATGKIWYSALLMLFFSLGRGLPLVVAGLSIGALKKMDKFKQYLRLVEKIGGVVLVLMGIYYLVDVIRLYLIVL